MWIMSALLITDRRWRGEGSSLLSDVKLEKQFSGTGSSKGPPVIGVCDVRSVTKAMPVFI